MNAVITPTNMHGLASSLQSRQQHQHHHHHHHHHYNLTSSQHHLLLTPPNTKTTSLNLQQTSIALGGKQQSQPLCGNTRQNSNTNSSGNSSLSNRTYLPPMRLEYQQPYCVAEPYVTDSIVYADLALAANGRREPHLLPHYRPPQNSTEYAILKFHDVGQEIDV